MLVSFTEGQAKAANFICSTLALIILSCRVVLLRGHKKACALDSCLVLASIVFLIARVPVVALVLSNGTASDTIDQNQSYFDRERLEEIKKGSILSLVARVLITAVYWLQSCILLRFYGHILQHIKWISTAVIVTWVIAIVTLVAVVLVTFLECRPLRLYWQVLPQPSRCAKANVQILLQCVSNLIIDLMLLVIAVPIFLHKGYTWKQRTRVWLLCFLGMFCAITTSLRLAYLYNQNPSQNTRSVLASIQIITSTFVANTPIIYGSLRLIRSETSDSNHSRPSPGNIGESLNNNEITQYHNHQRFESLSSSSTRKDWFEHVENAVHV